MSAWGRTGRVEVEGMSRYVLVDHKIVGYATNNYAETFVYNGDRPWAKAPSLDAAVLWVLRRVDPALWRQERGAWLVRKARPGDVMDVWGEAVEPDRERFPWAVVDPDGFVYDCWDTLPKAHRDASMAAAEKAVAP